MIMPFDKLKVKFDKIYLLTMSNRRERSAAAFKMLEKIGVKDERDIEIIYATPFPYNDIIADAFNKTGKGKFTKPNEYDCARNHYSMVKRSYDLGYENILIMEDDIRFISDIVLFDEYIDAMPKDYDICQFCGFSADPRISEYMKDGEWLQTRKVDNIVQYTKDGLWVKHHDVGLWTTGMYALSRRGMEFYLAFMDKFFWVADGPLYKAPINDKLVNTYMSNIPLAIQVDKDIVSSDIRDKSNDDIDYNSQNMYEKNVKQDDYFEYK